MSLNLELKARIASLEECVAIAREMGAEDRGLLVQEDTYFHVRCGRLKLRERQGVPAELVYYERKETGDERWCDYELFAVEQPALLKTMLCSALGTLAVVNKSRRLFLYEGARIHLDEVALLGQFLEFEVPGGKRAVDLMKELRAKFRVAQREVIRGSYCDLISGKRFLAES